MVMGRDVMLMLMGIAAVVNMPGYDYDLVFAFCLLILLVHYFK